VGLKAAKKYAGIFNLLHIQKKFTSKPGDPRMVKPITRLTMYLMENMSASSVLHVKSEA
jgi:hypothetical protein